MTTIGDKVAHVLRGARDDRHHCHWPGCDKPVPPAKWGCSKHWFMLPRDLRGAIWATYNIGQEQTKTPSRAYVTVARRVQDWIHEHHPETKLVKPQQLTLGVDDGP